MRLLLVLGLLLLVIVVALLVVLCADRRPAGKKMGGGVTVGPGDVTDAAEIARLKNEYRTMLKGVPIYIPETVSNTEAGLIRPYIKTFVVRGVGKSLKGFIQVTPGRVNSVDWLVVDCNHRGQGVGSALLSAALEWLPAEKTIIIPAVDNDAARRLYEKFGFVTPEGGIMGNNYYRKTTKRGGVGKPSGAGRPGRAGRAGRAGKPRGSTPGSTLTTATLEDESEMRRITSANGRHKYRDEHYRGVLTEDHINVFVVREGKTIAGFIVIFPGQKNELDLQVDPAHPDQRGVAEKLLRAALEWLPEAPVVIDDSSPTTAPNEILQGVYTRAGFTAAAGYLTMERPARR